MKAQPMIEEFQADLRHVPAHRKERMHRGGAAWVILIVSTALWVTIIHLAQAVIG